MICGNIEEGQLIHPGGYGVEWVGRRTLLREVELILKGPLRNLPCDEDGGAVGEAVSQAEGWAQAMV